MAATLHFQINIPLADDGHVTATMDVPDLEQLIGTDRALVTSIIDRLLTFAITTRDTPPAPVVVDQADRTANYKAGRYVGPPVACPQCPGRTFRTPGFLRSHNRQSHSPDSVDNLAFNPEPDEDLNLEPEDETDAAAGRPADVDTSQPPPVDIPVQRRGAPTQDIIDQRRARAAASAVSEW